MCKPPKDSCTRIYLTFIWLRWWKTTSWVQTAVSMNKLSLNRQGSLETFFCLRWVGFCKSNFYLAFWSCWFLIHWLVYRHMILWVGKVDTMVVVTSNGVKRHGCYRWEFLTGHLTAGQKLFSVTGLPQGKSSLSCHKRLAVFLQYRGMSYTTFWLWQGLWECSSWWYRLNVRENKSLYRLKFNMCFKTWSFQMELEGLWYVTTVEPFVSAVLARTLLFYIFFSDFFYISSKSVLTGPGCFTQLADGRLQRENLKCSGEAVVLALRGVFLSIASCSIHHHSWTLTLLIGKIKSISGGISSPSQSTVTTSKLLHYTPRPCDCLFTVL